MKKGFTLIELLVTIVVIGLVAMIAFPTVGNIITSMKERSFVESRKGLIRAARLYMEANQDLLPYNKGDITEVAISTLVSEKYIKEVKSPVDGSACGGYVLVRRNDQTAYDYYPQYRCGASNGVTSRATDSLVLDYTFDDFQEPTVNLIPNSPINSYPKIGNTHGTYNTNQYNNNTYFSIGTVSGINNNIVTLSAVGMPIYTYDVLTPQTTGGGVTAGTRYFIKKLSNNTFTLHAYDSSQDGSKGFRVYDSINNNQRININATGFPTMWHGPAHLPNSALVKEIIPNCFSTLGADKHECIRLHTSHKPDGSVDGMAYNVTPTVVAGKTYTFSFYYRAVDEQSVGKTIHLSAHTTTGWPNMNITQTLSREWKRYVTTSIAPASGTAMLYFWPSKNANVDISEIQVEEKFSVTEFTAGTRTGTITDYSGTGKNAPLALVSTPRWIEDSVRKSGVYQFEGTNTYIDAGLNADYHLTTGSISLWANTSRSYPSDTTSAGYRGLISKTVNGGSSGTSYFIDWNGTNSTRTLRAAIGDATNVNQVTVSNFDFKNTWNHIVFTWNGTKLYLYVNGEKVGETNQTRVVQNLNKSLEIGRAFGANVYNWSGSIDQVKMYQRELLDTEIKSLYFMERVN